MFTDNMQYQLDYAEDPACSTKIEPIYCATCEDLVRDGWYLDAEGFCSVVCMNAWIKLYTEE